MLKHRIVISYYIIPDEDGNMCLTNNAIRQLGIYIMRKRTLDDLCKDFNNKLYKSMEEDKTNYDGNSKGLSFSDVIYCEGMTHVLHNLYSKSINCN